MKYEKEKTKTKQKKTYCSHLLAHCCCALISPHTILCLNIRHDTSVLRQLRVRADSCAIFNSKLNRKFRPFQKINRTFNLHIVLLSCFIYWLSVRVCVCKRIRFCVFSHSMKCLKFNENLIACAVHAYRHDAHH